MDCRGEAFFHRKDSAGMVGVLVSRIMARSSYPGRVVRSALMSQDTMLVRESRVIG